MTSSIEKTFKRNYESLLQHLKLNELQPKTIETYSRGMRRIRAQKQQRKQKRANKSKKQESKKQGSGLAQIHCR